MKTSVIIVNVSISLDDIATKIINIFRRGPSRGLRSHQIRDILEYEGYITGYGQIRYRLQRLSLVGVLEREKGSHYDRYYLREIF